MTYVWLASKQNLFSIISLRHSVQNCWQTRMAIAKHPAYKTPPKKEGIFKSAFSKTLLQFSSKTSLHGIRHVNDTRGNRYTRAFWFIIPIFCFFCAIALMVIKWCMHSDGSMANLISPFRSHFWCVTKGTRHGSI